MTDKKIKQYLGLQLKKRREQANLRQDDIAKVLNLSRVSVINMESGRHNPSIKNIITLCRLFNCAPNDIFPPIEELKYSIIEKIVTIKKKKKVLKIIK